MERKKPQPPPTCPLHLSSRSAWCRAGSHGRGTALPFASVEKDAMSGLLTPSPGHSRSSTDGEFTIFLGRSYLLDSSS